MRPRELKCGSAQVKAVHRRIAATRRYEETANTLRRAEKSPSNFEVPTAQTQATGSAIREREIPADKYTIDGGRIWSQCARKSCIFARQSFQVRFKPRETLKTETALDCLLFYSSTIIENVQEDSAQS